MAVTVVEQKIHIFYDKEKEKYVLHNFRYDRKRYYKTMTAAHKAATDIQTRDNEYLVTEITIWINDRIDEIIAEMLTGSKVLPKQVQQQL